jgi:hypothetical protein
VSSIVEMAAGERLLDIGFGREAERDRRPSWLVATTMRAARIDDLGLAATARL